jgi:DNA-binding transcriptional LysR family regulator
MEIYQVRAFVTVAKLGSITRAAEVLHVTQPAVTAQIKALEEELGVALFDRRPGRISVTRAGEALLPQAELLLDSASVLLGKARELQGEVTGQFVLGTVADPDALRLGSLLAAIVKALPLLEIRTRAGLAEELREQIGAGALHGAFYIGPHIPREAAGLALQTQHYRVVAPAAMRQRVLRAGWRDLADLPWIGAPAQHHVQTLLKDLFAARAWCTARWWRWTAAHRPWAWCAPAWAWPCCARSLPCPPANKASWWCGRTRAWARNCPSSIPAPPSTTPPPWPRYRPCGGVALAVTRFRLDATAEPKLARR